MIKKNILNDYNKRFLFNKNQNNNLINKLLINNKIIEKNIREQLFLKQKKTASKLKIRNKCLLTGRSRGVFKFFKKSRIQIKNQYMSRSIPGLKASSW